MSYLRFTVDLAVKEPLPPTLAEKLPAIRQQILQLKAFATRINQGRPNEEMTVKATYHVCRHEEGLPCEPEIEIT